MILTSLMLVLMSQTIESRTERWCVDLHPKYTDSDRVICRAAFTIGAVEGIRFGRNESNEDFDVDADGRQIIHIKGGADDSK